MKKALAFTAIAVMLLTFFVCTNAVLDTGGNDQPDMKLNQLGAILGLIVVILTLISEVGLFSGIALLLSKNKTALKTVFGAVIVVISLIFLIALLNLIF